MTPIAPHLRQLRTVVRPVSPALDAVPVDVTALGGATEAARHPESPGFIADQDLARVTARTHPIVSRTVSRYGNALN